MTTDDYEELSPAACRLCRVSWGHATDCPDREDTELWT